jgi:hypothetical protein
MNFGNILPVLTLLIGWFLKEFSDFFQSKRERRKVIGIAVSDLLEIRDRMVAYRRTLDSLQKRFRIAPLAAANLSKIMESIIPSIDNFQERYEKTLSLIATTDPVLAFRLRSRYVFNPAINKLKDFLGADYLNLSFVMKVEGFTTQAMLTVFDELILELAKMHSKKTVAEIQKQLNRYSAEPPPEVGAILSFIEENLQAKGAEMTRGSIKDKAGENTIIEDIDITLNTIAGTREHPAWYGLLGSSAKALMDPDKFYQLVLNDGRKGKIILGKDQGDFISFQGLGELKKQ